MARKAKKSKKSRPSTKKCPKGQVAVKAHTVPKTRKHKAYHVPATCRRA